MFCPNPLFNVSERTLAWRRLNFLITGDVLPKLLLNLYFFVQLGRFIFWKELCFKFYFTYRVSLIIAIHTCTWVLNKFCIVVEVDTNILIWKLVPYTELCTVIDPFIDTYLWRFWSLIVLNRWFLWIGAKVFVARYTCKSTCW